MLAIIASFRQIYRILGKYIIAAQREFIFTQLHHISLTNHKFPSRYLVRKPSPSKMHPLFCHLFSVILYEDRSVCAVNVMHKSVFSSARKRMCCHCHSNSMNQKNTCFNFLSFLVYQGAVIIYRSGGVEEGGGGCRRNQGVKFLFKICKRRLIPSPFPLKTMRSFPPKFLDPRAINNDGSFGHQ